MERLHRFLNIGCSKPRNGLGTGGMLENEPSMLENPQILMSLRCREFSGWCVENSGLGWIRLSGDS